MIETLLVSLFFIVSPSKDDKPLPNDEAFSGSGVLINSEYLNGLNVPEESIKETIKILEKKKFLKEKKINDK